MTLAYRVKLEKDDNGTLLVTCRVRQLRNEGITRAELVRRLHWNRESVDRLFRLDHNSRIDQIEAAFKALGRKLDIEVHAA